jgi:hypothetical protein
MNIKYIQTFLFPINGCSWQEDLYKLDFVFTMMTELYYPPSPELIGFNIEQKKATLNILTPSSLELAQQYRMKGKILCSWDSQIDVLKRLGIHEIKMNLIKKARQKPIINGSPLSFDCSIQSIKEMQYHQPLSMRKFEIFKVTCVLPKQTRKMQNP